MRIYSWNMLYLNPDLDRAFDFIRKLQFDVLCLQEVPEAFLSRLKTLPLSLAAGIETDWVEPAHMVRRLYCVILSPHNILSSYDFAFPKFEAPWRTEKFISFMRRWDWRRVRNRRSLYADIEMPRGLTRVFSLHLTLSYPNWLMTEFETAAKLRDPAIPAVFCGDLNIIESYRATPLNWVLGGSFGDIVHRASARTNAEKRFAELGLQNPLRGKVTQKPSFSQLDHILVPKDFDVKNADVLSDSIGSDHHPVFVECE